MPDINNVQQKQECHTKKSDLTDNNRRFDDTLRFIDDTAGNHDQQVPDNNQNSQPNGEIRDRYQCNQDQQYQKFIRNGIQDLPQFCFLGVEPCKVSVKKIEYDCQDIQHDQEEVIGMGVKKKQKEDYRRHADSNDTERIG